MGNDEIVLALKQRKKGSVRYTRYTHLGLSTSGTCNHEEGASPAGPAVPLHGGPWQQPGLGICLLHSDAKVMTSFTVILGYGAGRSLSNAPALPMPGSSTNSRTIPCVRCGVDT